jgi:hypothetical protein
MNFSYRVVKVALSLLQTLAHGVRRCLVPCHWNNGVLAGSFPKDQAGDNLVVRGQDCRMDAAELCIQNM